MTALPTENARSAQKAGPPQIGIIGIGNLLLGDEGFGVHVLNYLTEHFDFPDNVTLMDAGTAAIYMVPFIETVNLLFVFDVVDVKAPPGSIHCFTSDEVRAGKIQTKMSPHQLGLLEMVDICALRGKAPDALEYICVVPEKLDTSITLSPLLESQITHVIDILLKRLTERGVHTALKAA